MARNLNSEQFQIPKAHHDAILSAIEHHGKQGITFSPTSTDYRDETGKVHRVPVDGYLGRYLLVDMNDPKQSTYDHALPTESMMASYLHINNRNSYIEEGGQNTSHSSPGLADRMRRDQLAAADAIDKQAHELAHEIRDDPALRDVVRTRMAARKVAQRLNGDGIHVIHVGVNSGEHPTGFGEYEYDTRTGNIGPARGRPTPDGWSKAMREAEATIHPESGNSRNIYPLRSFERD